MEKDIAHQIELFDLKRQLEADDFTHLDNLQNMFVSDFSVERIRRLKIDEYVIGKGSKTSFCYRLERQLGALGDMRGSTSSVFVVYYGKKGGDTELKYRYTKKLGKATDELDALKKAKEAIISLIDAGARKDREAIKRNRLADLYKFKLLGTYYPDQYLNIYSPRHLNYFIGELGLNPIHASMFGKQDALLAFKNENKICREWSNYEFNNFLYHEFGRPPANEEGEKEQDVLPAIEDIKPEIIDLTITNYVGGSKKGKGTAKPDYIERQERNSKLGKRGENIVFNLEEAFLRQNNFSLDKLEHSSKKDDRLGYDIKSLDENGIEKFIEVKSTRTKKGSVNFAITDNEKTKAKKLPNYYIYVVFEANTTSPKIWKIKEPFKGLHEKFKVTPTSYKVEVTVTK